MPHRGCDTAGSLTYHGADGCGEWVGPRCYPGCYDYTNVLASVILATLNAAIEKSLADPNLMVNFIKGSLESGGGSPEKLGTLAKADSVKYARLVKELKISAT